MTPDSFVQLLNGVKPRGRDKWLACCPAHDDKDPSLSVTATPQGKILLKCFAGCSALEVVHSLGLELPDLFPDDHTEDPMAFARKEMAQKRHEKKYVNYAITFLAIVTEKMKRGERVPEEDIEKAHELKAFLKRKVA